MSSIKPLNQVAGADQPQLWRARLLAALVVVLQLFWLKWFMAEPLPNATPVGSGDKISRGLLLFTTTPGLNPNFRWSQSLVGQAVEELSHLGRLADRLPVIATAALVLAGAWGLGLILLRCLDRIGQSDWRPGERGFIALPVGLAGWQTLTLMLGRNGLLQQWLWLALAIGFGCFAVFEFVRTWKLSQRPQIFALTQLVPWPAWPFLVVMILASMLPTIDFDCIEYHLQGPKEYWLAGKITYLPHNIYTNMPFGVEMLHTSAMSLSGSWQTGALAGQLLIGLHPLLVAGFITLFAQRLGRPKMGWWASLFYLSTPWTYRLAAIPYVEGPLCAATAGWLWAVQKAWGDRHKSSWALVGLMAGWAMSCKYTAILPVVVPCAAVLLAALWRQKSASPLIGIVLGGSLVFGPWLVKNLIDTGNPVYPLAWNIFGGQDWDTAMNAKWAAAHGRKPIQTNLLASSLVEVAGRSDWQTPLFMAFAPLALVGLKPVRKSLMLLMLLAGWIFLSWWLFTHRLDRFWLPIQPLLALLAGAGALAFEGTRPGRAWRAGFVAISLCVNWVYVSTSLSGLNEWTHPLDQLWASVPNRLYPASVLVDRSLQHTDKVLLVGQAAVFYWQKPILYNTVFNRERIETLSSGKSSAEIHAELKRLGVTHLFVDWFEIRRYRQPGNYGFTDFVTQDFFDTLVRDQVLASPSYPAPQKTLYKVKD